MKKLVISLALIFTLCLPLFMVSCGDTATGCTHEYDNTYCDTRCNLCGKPYSINGHQMVGPSIEGCQVPVVCTRCGYQTCEEWVIDHLFVDEFGNVLEVCARCNQPNPDLAEPKPEPEPTPNPEPTPEPEPEPEPEPKPEPKPEPDPGPKIATSYLQYTYDYGWHVLGKLTLLCDDGYFDNSFGRIEVPDDVVAGDMIEIVHTGEIWTQESYPGSHSLYNGEIISYSFEYASVIHLTGEKFSIEKIIGYYDYQAPFVILDRTGKYVSLDEYTGTEIYLVTDQQKYAKIFENIDPEMEAVPDVNYPIAAMFAYNPRDLEDGKAEHNISEEEAIEIAMEAHYLRDNFLPKGFEYKPRIIKGDNPAYYYVFFDVEYVGEDDVDPDMQLMECLTYTCIIDKETGEILK